MAQGARVQSVQTLHMLSSALVKFAHAADLALADAEGDMTHTLMWLQNEQQMYWRAEVRKRQELLTRAKEALRMKTIYRDSSGRPPAADEERKAVQLAMRRVEDAQAKIASVRKWTLQLQKAMTDFQATVRRLGAAVQSDVPRAAAMLDQAALRLQAYVDLNAPAPAAPPPSPQSDPSSMGRAIEDESVQQPEEGDDHGHA